MDLKLEEITWEEIWADWKYRASFDYPELLESIPLKYISFEFEGEAGIYGYDWLATDEMDSRINYVTTKPREFLWFGTSLNKGTLQTATNLIEAKDDAELQAAVWLYAAIVDFRNDLPHNWRGDTFRLIRAMENAIRKMLGKNGLSWHYAMRRLLPGEYVSDSLLDQLKIEHFSQIVEIAAIKASLVRSHYHIVLYDSVEKGI